MAVQKHNTYYDNELFYYDEHGRRTPLQVGRVYSAGSGIKIDDENVISISADYVSATELEKYYKKTETSAASAISAKFDEVTAWADETFLKEHQSLNGISAEFSATSAWALKTFQLSGDYYQKFETSSKEEIQNALNLKQDVSGMSAYQLSGDYVSASDFNAYKELVKQEFTNTSAWATSSFQPSGKYITSASDDLANKNLVLKDNKWTELVETDWTPTISAASANAINSAVDIVKNKFTLTEDNKASGYDGIPFYHQSLEDYYKKSETSAASAISAAFKNTSAWANETFQPIGEYISASEKFLSANALDNVSGAWNSVVSTVESNSANWNEASAFAANSAKFVTSAIEQFQDNLSYFLAKSGTSTVWSGVDLSNLDKPLMSGYGTSAWYDETQGKYFVSANIVGINGISAAYDASNNQWKIGASASNLAYLQAYYDNSSLPVASGSVIKFNGGVLQDISVDENGYITIPSTVDRMTVCMNATIDSNIPDPDPHNYMLNQFTLSAVNGAALVRTHDYYPSEVGAADSNIATTIKHDGHSKYCIVYEGNDIKLQGNLHVHLTMLEEVVSLSDSSAAERRYSGNAPVYVNDQTNQVSLKYDNEFFTLKDVTESGETSKVLTLADTHGQEVDPETFQSLLDSVDHRIVETLPIGIVNAKDNQGAGVARSYLFRPMIQFDMKPGTTARVLTYQKDSSATVQIAVFEVTDEATGALYPIWISEQKTLDHSAGEHVLQTHSSCTLDKTIYPERLYYVVVITRSGHVGLIGISNGLTDDTGICDIAYWNGNENTEWDISYVLSTKSNCNNLGSTGQANFKPYVGFRNP